MRSTGIGWLVAMIVALCAGWSVRAGEDFLRGVETSSVRVAPVLSGGRVGGFEHFSRGFWAKIGGSAHHLFGGDDAFLTPQTALLALWISPEMLDEVSLVLVDPPLGEGRAVTIRAADALVRSAGGSIDRGMLRSAARTEERLRLLGIMQSDVVLAVWDGAAWVPVDHPDAPEDVRNAWEEVRSAWLAHDAQRINSALETLGSVLEAHTPESAPRWKRELEWGMERWGVFGWCGAAFVLSALCWLAVGVRGVRLPRRIGLIVHALSVCLLLGAFTARGIVAERLAVQNQFESMLGLALLIGGIGLVWAWRRGSGSLPGENPGAGALPGAGAMVGGVSAAGSAMVLISALVGGVPGMTIERESAILSESGVLGWHVGAMLIGYSAALVAGVGGVLALLGVRTHGMVRAGVRLAFWAMTLGILLGAYWADRAWGRWWAWDAKETWSLVTWCIYLAGVHARGVTAQAEGREPRGPAWLAIVGLVSVAWTYLGVNLLMTSLHSYAG